MQCPQVPIFTLQCHIRHQSSRDIGCLESRQTMLGNSIQNVTALEKHGIDPLSLFYIHLSLGSVNLNIYM